PTAMRLYINGQLDGETVRESNYASTGDAIQLTRVGAAELIVPCDGACKTRFPFNGSIDELMVFDYPLSASEVLTMYQNFDIYKED
ncbi:MAG: LamG-like jellyroll fold domain-containing protein, partial [Deinococcota bacterium]